MLVGRIHFSIHYPDLGFDARKQLWNMFFGEALTSDVDMEDAIDSLAKLPLNGRQV